MHRFSTIIHFLLLCKTCTVFTGTFCTCLKKYLKCIISYCQKIYDELVSTFGDSQRAPTIEDLNQLKYLECYVKESLRLYPSVPGIMRQITEETSIGTLSIYLITTYNKKYLNNNYQLIYCM